jgi:uncharacterized protein (DUF4415 family)
LNHFSFDPSKSERNIALRRLSFELVNEFEWETSLSRKPQAEQTDRDNPQADAAWFKRARPAKEVLPDLLGHNAAQHLLTPKRGRPPLPATKSHINLRLDADIVEQFKQSGRGWQTRMNLALREWLATNSF